LRRLGSEPQKPKSAWIGKRSWSCTLWWVDLGQKSRKSLGFLGFWDSSLSSWFEFLDAAWGKEQSGKCHYKRRRSAFIDGIFCYSRASQFVR
jgi:hypothetical protein